MNPDQPNLQPAGNLPSPVSSEANAGVDSGARNVEQAAFAPELPQAGGPASQMPVNNSAADALAMHSAAATNSNAQPAQVPQQPTGGLTATDADLIEKEWVTRAKSIVEKSKDNPHVQNKEMNKFKAEYIKKRYNKELKVSEG